MRTSLRAISISLLAGLGVSACQTISSVTGLGSDASPTPAPTPAVVQAPAAPTAPATTKTVTLKGMDSAAVTSLWGEPALRRKDIGSELWTYNKGGAACAVLLYLYPDREGRMLVTRSEAVPGGADENAVEACAKTNNLPSLKPVS